MGGFLFGKAILRRPLGLSLEGVMSTAYIIVYVLATIWIKIYEKFPVSLGLA